MKTKSSIIAFILTAFLAMPAFAQSLDDHLKAGVQHMNAGENEEALAEFKKAMEFDTDGEGHPLLYSYAGLCAKYIGDDQQAKKYFAVAVDRNVDDEETYSLLGNICKEQDDLDCQITTYKKAMEQFPSKSQEYGKKLVYAYYKAEKYGEMVDLTSTLLKSEPTDENLLQLRATALQKNKDFNGAKEVYEKILSINPDDYTANAFLGNYYYQVGKSKLDQAEKKYNAIKDPSRVEWSQHVKNNKTIMNQYYTQAVTYLEKAYKQKQTSNLKKMLYAAYFKLGNNEKSELYRE